MDEFDDEGDDVLASVMYNDVYPNPDERSANDVGLKSKVEDLPVYTEVSIPKSFPFPFEPYNIQQNFMNQLYQCLEQGKIGIFESPTGTGKSLSLICGALKWLKDLQEKQRKELEALTTDKGNKENIITNNLDNTEVDWITEFVQKKEKEEQLKKVISEHELLKKQESKTKERRSSQYGHSKKRKKIEDEFDNLIKGASREIQEAYNSEIDKGISDVMEDGNVDGQDEDLIVQDYKSDDERNDEKSDDEEEECHITKIYYCSRTHSQLSQFVREVVKSPYGDNTRVVSLGSRQNLCINETVKKLKSISLINDACLDMQKSKSEKREHTGEAKAKRRKRRLEKCPYYRQEGIGELKEELLLEVKDMEQIVTKGKEMKACPFYGTRHGIPLAEIVALPYNLLLHKATRVACGIKLEGNIVLIDEAHNLLETINNIHSMEVTGSQLLRAHSQLTQYEERYRSRLKAKNLMYIKQILFVLSCLLKIVGGKTGLPGGKQFTGKAETRMCTTNNFLFQANLDNLNLFKILQYCKKSMISRKLNGFAEKYPNAEVTPKEETKVTGNAGVLSFLREITKPEISQGTTPNVSPEVKSVEDVVLRSPLMHIEGFLQALTNADTDGRIVVTKQTMLSQSSMKYLLLNPAIHFSDVLREARSVIVAGGTMQPISEFKDQLFHSAGVHPTRLLEYSCGHVIPEDHLLALSLGSGPSGYKLDFTYQSRESRKLLDELGMLIQNVCQVVPSGVICFFPSYDYLKLVYVHWEETGFIQRIARKKRVFQEPRKSSQVDQVLAEFSSCIKSSSKQDTCGVTGSTGSLTGALLLCVVGGKMSEGINFSDELGRCVIMVGLPYPNINSPELKEKMNYLNANFKAGVDGRQPGQVHYENLCMKAVNQSIGRAIRHKGDYSSILLLDKRYSHKNVSGKLPSWIGKSLQNIDKFGQAMSSLSRFFASKKVSQM
ncbi:ATP-dependent DNA helicase DDX11-like [Ylistrum balloti]|uniref:ATP-dependent DNA helicase DDX11-like n=1 Tax=Ylistrum balloti TaxID=509963 RepID=UPI0029057D98|nr:ATP-dependent DNA helicase DDX11-like [Ylistrum balloti]